MPFLSLSRTISSVTFPPTFGYRIKRLDPNLGLFVSCNVVASEKRKAEPILANASVSRYVVNRSIDIEPLDVGPGRSLSRRTSKILRWKRLTNKE